ncbi:hypothetical protein PGT21_009516 [Puccinia graminis f. sp. tritici]|uniref:Uncharacterized protein n=1 Tax=Puccinia graminis f. sp. tritici TaxID=56615 RepID=A0A5B0PPN1_PUCGR|nr:hypothetical protein PGT21_009516 [Puccinia graminis f. sp. tritici]
MVRYPGSSTLRLGVPAAGISFPAVGGVGMRVASPLLHCADRRQRPVGAALRALTQRLVLGSGFGIGFGRSGIRSDAENPQTSVLTWNPRIYPGRGPLCTLSLLV